MNTYTGYTLISAFKDFFSRYADFSGRSTLSAYWYWVLASVIINFIAAFIGAVLDTDIIGYIWGLLIFIPTWAIAVRRLHDIGKSGWNLLWSIIPTIAFCLVSCCFIASVAMDVAALDIDFEQNPGVLLKCITGQTSWLYALMATAVLALAGAIVIFVFSLLDSQKGTNKWGASEKYPDEALPEPIES